MATYASANDLAAYVAANRAAQRSLRRIDPDRIETLLQRGERAVDGVVGPAWPRDSATGLRLNPAALTQAQRDAAARATCAFAEWVLTIGAEVEAGDAVERPSGVAFAQPPARQPPKLLSELAGYGLLRRTATVAADPEPPPGHPWFKLEERAIAEG